MDRIRTFAGSNRFHVALVCFILILSIYLRFYQFAQPETWGALDNGDYGRDYIVANHIVKYGEFPANGPDERLGSMWVSPLYFYILSIVLLVNNDIKFLSLFNVFLQILSLLGVYALARTLLGKGTGLIALTLFGLSNAIIWQSYIIWQPHVMQPFIILSYLLLALGYQRRSISLLISSIASFWVSITLHYSVLAILPAYLVLLILAFRKAGAKTKDYMQAGMVAIAIGALLYAPAIIFMDDITNELSNITSVIFSHIELSIPILIGNLMDRVSTLFSFFLDNDAVFFRPPSYNVFLIYTAMGVMFVALAVYFLKKRKDEQYYAMFAITSTIASFLLIAAFFRYDFYWWYLTPIMSLFVIVLSELVYRIGGRNILTSVARTGVVLGLVYILLGNTTLWNQVKETPLKKVVARTFTFFTSGKGVDTANPTLQSILHEINTLSDTQQNLNFFDFRIFSDYNESLLNVDDADILWAQLEYQLNARLVMVDSFAERDYSPIVKQPIYIFLLCRRKNNISHLVYWPEDNALSNKKCLNAFSGELSGYFLERQIYSSEVQSIFLMKRDG